MIFDGRGRGVVCITMGGRLGKMDGSLDDWSWSEWSDLPDDIVRYIMGKLFWIDRIRMRAVCKNWRSISLRDIALPTIDNPTWRMDYSWLPHEGGRGVRSLCLFNDKSLGETVVVEYSIKKTEERGIFVGAFAESCQYGWVLFRQYQEASQPTRSFRFFLYSPFSDEVILLPELLLLDPNLILPCMLVATFHLNSANPDCLVFCLRNVNQTISINTCRPGDVGWTSHKFHSTGTAFSDPLSATYHQGSFYCMFATGQLGAFNVALQQWTVLVNRWSNKVIKSAVLVASSGPPPCVAFTESDYFPWCGYSLEKQVRNGGMVKLSSSGDLIPQITYYKERLKAKLNMPYFDLCACADFERSSKQVLIAPPYQGMWRRSDLVRAPRATTTN